MTRRRLRRTAGVAAAALAAVAAPFLLLAWGTHALLTGDRLLALVDGSPESLFVAYTGPRASLVPGRVSFATLFLRSRDPNVEWEARLEDVRVDVSLPSLLGRTFRATSVRAARLRFRLRERLTRREAADGRARRYPQIAGFPGPPLRGERTRVGTSERPWRAVVDSLVVSRVSEIWIDGWRWEGDASLRGGFRLDPGREAEVLASEIALARGALRFGGDTVSRALSGRVRARIPDFATRQYPGNDVWKIVSGDLDLRATLDAVPFLAGLGLPRVSVAPGTQGSFRASGSLDAGAGAGALRAGAEIVAAPAGRPYRTRATLDARVDRVDFGAARLDGRVAARLADGRLLVELVPAGAPRWLASLPDLTDFAAAGRLRAASDLVALADVRATAAGLEARADWRRRGRREWGALLVRKGSLSVATGLGPGTPGLKVVGASTWFDDEARPGGLRTDQPRAEAPARDTR